VIIMESEACCYIDRVVTKQYDVSYSRHFRRKRKRSMYTGHWETLTLGSTGLPSSSIRLNLIISVSLFSLAFSTMSSALFTLSTVYLRVVS
jgi:hypothetical protein